MKMLAQNKKLRSAMMSAPSAKAAELPGALQPSCRKTAAHALSIVRDGVITGEGPTTTGRIHGKRRGNPTVGAVVGGVAGPATPPPAQFQSVFNTGRI